MQPWICKDSLEARRSISYTRVACPVRLSFPSSLELACTGVIRKVFLDDCFMMMRRSLAFGLVAHVAILGGLSKLKFGMAFL